MRVERCGHFWQFGSITFLATETTDGEILVAFLAQTWPQKLSRFDPTSANSIRGVNGAVRFLLSTSHSERCYTVNIHVDLT